MVKKTILITGANGEIGQGLVAKLKENKKNTIVALDLSNDIYKSKIVDFITGSILDQHLIKNIFREYHIDAVYHLAAILSTKAEKNKLLAYDVNVNGTKYLIDQAIKQKHNISFFFPSSIAVYNILHENNSDIIKESDIFISPATIYGKTKLKSEEYGVKNNSTQFDFRCIRFPGIISATSMPSGGTSDFAPEMIHYAAQNKVYNCFVNSETRIPFMVMPDAIKGILTLMNSPKKCLNQTIYNISSFNPSASNFYLETKKYYKNFKLHYEVDELRQNIVNSWPDNIDDNAARSDWYWSPDFNLATAYEKYLIPVINDYYKET